MLSVAPFETHSPGVLNSREHLRAAVIGSRTARGVVGTLNLTTGNGGQGQGRITRSMVDMIVFVVSALIGTMADAHKSRNCAAAR